MTKEEVKEIFDHNWTKLVNPDYSDDDLAEAQNWVIETLSAKPQGDLISREDVLNEIIRFSTEEGSSVECQQLYCDVNNMPPVKQTEWISVKDRLPKESDEYYVSIRYECENKTTFDNVTTCYFWAKEKMWKGSERMIGKILAWQPITEPSPYKGE